MHQLLLDGAAREPDKMALHLINRNKALTYAQSVEATVRIFDGDDRELPIGQVGEICLRGRLMKGYCGRPERLQRRCAAAGCIPAMQASSTKRAMSPCAAGSPN